MNIKKLIYLLLLVPALSMGQKFNVQVIPPVSTTTNYSDDFESYTVATSIDGQGNWVVVRGDIEINTHDSDKGFDGADVYFNLAYYDGSVDDDQYSQITVEAKVPYACPGPAVRVVAGTSGTGYLWFSENTTSAYLIRLVDGTPTYLVYGTDGWDNDDVVKLSIEGDEISMYRNGSLDTSMSTDGKYSDTSVDKLTTGSVGIVVYEQNSSAWGDTWSGGSL